MNKKLNDLAPCPCGQSDQHQSHALLPGAGRAVTDERADNGKAQSTGTKREEDEMTFKAYQEQKISPEALRIQCAFFDAEQVKKVKTQSQICYPL